jgi:hypothetical protein
MKQSKTVSVAEISFATLAKKHRISSMEFYDFRPAVIKIEAGYSIRTYGGDVFRNHLYNQKI